MTQADTRKHCTNEQLVACLDGELSPLHEKSVRDHLVACWQCRARLKEFEERAMEVAKALAEDSFPGPSRVAAALGRFTEWEARNPEPAPPQIARLAAGPRWWKLVPVAAAAVAVVFLFVRDQARQRTAEEPTAVLSRVQQQERILFRSAVHQSFRVEVEQTRPPAPGRSTLLEVWSDPASERFSSRWTSAKGELMHAAWRPAGDHDFIFRAESGHVAEQLRAERPEANPLMTISGEGISVQALEAGFSRWLESRRWRPISVASDMAVFAGEDGTILDVQREGRGESGGTLTLSASRRVEGVAVTIRVEVDPETYQPRMEEIRFETTERAAVLRLAAERVESIPMPALNASLFEPDLKLTRRRPVPAPVVASPPQPTMPAPVESANMDVAELEVRYALHRAGACLGEPVEIVRDPDSGILVRGLAGSQARKVELLATLATLDEPVWLKLDLRTLEEALRDEQLQASLETEILEDRSGRDPPTEFSQSVVPAQEYLERHYRSRSDLAEESLTGWTADFTQSTVTQAEELLAEAWAIRRLAERYDRDRTTELTPSARYLLEAMLAGHLRGLERKVADLSRHTEPFLAEAVEAAGRQPGTRRIDSDAADWRDAALAIFEGVHYIHLRVNGLFAGAGLPVSGEGTASTLRLESPSESMATLLGDIRAVEGGLQKLDDNRPWNLSERERAAAK